MKADLFVNSDTFKYIEGSTEDDVFLKLSDFSELVSYIDSDFNDDTIFIDENNFYQAEILPSICMSDLLFIEHDSYENKDVLDILLLLVNRFESIPDTISDPIAFVNDKQNCSALIVLNKLDDIGISNDKQILSTKVDFINFHRECLIEFPLATTNEFLEEAKLCFSNLVIHEDNIISLKSVYKSHLKSIVVYLSIMNDYLISEFQSNEIYENNFVDFLNLFKSNHTEIEGASFQGSFKNATVKKQYEKCFLINGEEKKFYCEAHLKMFHDDRGTVSHGRIYFKAIKKNDKYVYIGIINKHMDD